LFAHTKNWFISQAHKLKLVGLALELIMSCLLNSLKGSLPLSIILLSTFRARTDLISQAHKLHICGLALEYIMTCVFISLKGSTSISAPLLS
jgi:hypothetical protein